MPPFYFLSFACAETLEAGCKEFDTYTEAFEAYRRYQISGYNVVIHETTDMALVEELRKQGA